MPVSRPSAVTDSPATIAPSGKKIRPAKVFKRQGKLTEVEKDLVTQIVQDQPREMSEAQIGSLARGLRRNKARIREVVEQAKDRFVEQTERYVDIHREATEGALGSEDFKTAQAGAQWFLENVAMEGARIIDKVKEEAPKGTRIMIGLALGGVTAPVPAAIEASVVEVDS